MMRTHAIMEESGNFGALIEIHDHSSDGFDSLQMLAEIQVLINLTDD